MIDTPFISQLMNINMDINEFYKGNIIIDEKYNIYLSDLDLIKQYPQYKHVIIKELNKVDKEVYGAYYFKIRLKQYY